MDDLLNEITGLTREERKKVHSWVASQPEEKAIEIFQDGVKKSYQIKETRPDLPGRLVKYCAFIIAARKGGWDTVKGKGFRVAEQKQYEDFTHLRKARAAEFMQKGRTPVLRKKILAYWGEVKDLKAEGMGFRSIAEYLAKARKVRTSASYLCLLWKEVENDRI